MTRYERLIASAHHRKTVTLNVPILKHALPCGDEAMRRGCEDAKA